MLVVYLCAKGINIGHVFMCLGIDIGLVFVC